MIDRPRLNIGLFGLGTVGTALCQILAETPSAGASIRKVCVRDIAKPRDVDVTLTGNADDIFNDPDINLVVELIDDADASLAIVRRALASGRPVVSGNKKMLARHLPELIRLQAETGTPLLYDASACGSIPVIRNLEEYYDNDLLLSVKGILNGSSNYVLSKVFNEGMTHSDALALASDNGFLESDPSLDLEGWDSLFKLVILTVHAFGLYVQPERVFTHGITTMTDADILFANEKRRRIKVVGHVEKSADGRLYMCVMPQLLSQNKYIYSVEDEFNGVVIKGRCYGKQFMFGKGAGGKPTAAAVLSDITALRYRYSYEYKKCGETQLPRFDNEIHFRAYISAPAPDVLDLVPVVDVEERFFAPGHCHAVGSVSLADLHRLQADMRRRNIFVAAFPRD